ncbi:alanine racemase [Ideonella paludis]|uniref:Alanine racemase n=1 Tax=Ideonella paludis TaxID=1233411 RepID=A0ABS5E0Y7_9BURK|nr:alanine racemase [Ideonella paludis]MBQ0937074.1 alanine racemase [Ideonella paludis]
MSTTPSFAPGLKGYPWTAPGLSRAQVGAQGWNVLAGDLPLPVAVLHRQSLQHNLSWMQKHVDDAGIGLAPHGKTTLSPELFQAQLQAGAWGITFASVHQLALGLLHGVPRALIANQVLQAADLLQLHGLKAAHPGLRAPFLLDSLAQLQAIEATFSAHALSAPFEVLLEWGLAQGRTGCRSEVEALALARAARASPAVSLVGLSTYEGLWGSGDSAADQALVQGLTDAVRRLAQRCDDEGLFEHAQVIITAGGSALFDQVSGALKPALSRPVLGLLRSGCYLTHDDGHYQRLVHMANRRMGCSDGDGLRAALRVWTLVQSCPEPGLVILNAGKRDASTDMGLPTPVAWAPAGARVAQAAPAGWSLSAMNDQHAYLRLADGAPTLQVGDRVALGISHPCTTFDKWRWMPVVDEGLNVVDAISTLF